MDDRIPKVAAAIAESLGYCALDKMDDRAQSRFRQAAIAARTLLAPDRPVATREAVPRQRTLIEGMTVGEIKEAFQMDAEWGEAIRGQSTAYHCARVAHRLANTAALECDPDARAMTEYHEWCALTPALRWPTWHDLSEDGKDYWRKRVAAMEKPHDAG